MSEIDNGAYGCTRLNTFINNTMFLVIDCWCKTAFETTCIGNYTVREELFKT